MTLNNSIKAWLLKQILRLFPILRTGSSLNKRLRGILKDITDDRDRIFIPTRGVEIGDLPAIHKRPIDTTKYIKNQGKWNSCASHAIATAIEISHTLNNTKYKDVGLSERDHWYYAREMEDKLPDNRGMQMRTMMKVAQRRGISPEKLCPYINSKMNEKPGAFTDSFARWWRIKHYYRIPTIGGVKEALFNMNPVVIGVRMNASFMNFDTGIVVRDNENTYGGHAVVLYGHNNMDKFFYGIGSWGRRYKQKGAFILPYNYVEKYGLDYWTFTIYTDKK